LFSDCTLGSTSASTQRRKAPAPGGAQRGRTSRVSQADPVFQSATTRYPPWANGEEATHALCSPRTNWNLSNIALRCFATYASIREPRFVASVRFTATNKSPHVTWEKRVPSKHPGFFGCLFLGDLECVKLHATISLAGNWFDLTTLHAKEPKGFAGPAYEDST
jgi:hypothetical protein